MIEESVKDWIIGGAALLSAGNFVWTWLRASHQPTTEAIEKLDACQDDHGRRIQSIESEMRHMPSKDDLQKVTVSLTAMLGRMDVIQTELAGTSRALRRMEDHIRGVQ